LAVSVSANVKVAQRMSGYASAAMTLDVYADLFDDDFAAVADKLSARLTALSLSQFECPRWDSNPHWTGFESVSSASWDTRALSGRLP
jgi:hypothetical protein